MSPSDPPRRQEPYLSTEDIIQRVRVTQGRAHPFLVFRGPMAVIGALAFVLCLLVLLHRAREHEHQRDLKAEQAFASPAAEARPDDPAEVVTQAAEADVRANPAEGGAQVSGGAFDAAQIAPAGVGSEAHTSVTISVVGRPGIIAMDGKRLTVDRRWSGKVSPGRHQLSVRCGNLTLKKRVDVEHKALKVSFDCSGRRP